MNCKEAIARWNQRLDTGGRDPALDGHLATCEECSRYVRQMSVMLASLDGLREETECITAGEATAPDSRSQRRGRRGWYYVLRPLTGLAAAIAVALGASMFFRADQGSFQERNGARAQVTGIDRADPPTLGISLRGDSADRYLVVSRPASRPGVQMFWLYPSVASLASGNDEP